MTISFKLKTLTPLYTGGINQNCDRLHETSIIGSLRWWYEILVRSMGGSVCDITSDDRCNYEKNKKCCDVCKIFGCTGLSRQFSLRTHESQLSKTPRFFIPSGRCYKGRNGKHNRAGGWYLPEGFWGEFRFDFISLNIENYTVLNSILLMYLHSGFTAKANSGYGIFHINNFEEIKNSISPLKQFYPPETNNYPMFQNLFFIKVQMPKPDLFSLEEIKLLKQKKVTWKDCTAKIPEGLDELEKHLTNDTFTYLPTAPILKNRLRKYKENNIRMFDKSEISGTIKGSPLASKINFSNLYQIDEIWEFRVWGWLKNNSLLDKLHNFIYSEIPIIFEFNPKDIKIQWREFDSSRDTVLKNELNAETYIRSLLND